MKLFLTAALLFTASFASAQTEPPYHAGLIVTVTDDTISCLVPMISAFGTAVLTKKIQDGPYDTIPVSKIKYLANGTNVYETVSFNTTAGMLQKLMWLQEEGKINLYEEYHFDDDDKKRVYGTGGTWTFNGNPIRICVIRKNNQTYLLSDKYFQDIVGPMVADKPAVAAKVISKTYTLKNVDTMVEEYNAGE